MIMYIMDPKFTILLFFILVPLLHVESYENYTVGDSLGWYDSLENPAVDYEKWVASKNFSLGDYLLFNTDNNHSVIQTYNFTTYQLCDYDDSTDNDTIQWSSSNPSSVDPHPVSVSVPLMRVGMTYFFSSDYDGEQCQHGQRFKINVTFGQGLPPGLKADDSPGPASPDPDDSDTVPDTLVPANFDNPKDMSDDGNDECNASVSLHTVSKIFWVQLYGVVILVGLVF